MLGAAHSCYVVEFVLVDVGRVVGRVVLSSEYGCP